MAEEAFQKVGHFKTVESFRERLSQLNLHLPCDEKILSAQENSPLAQKINLDGFIAGNRWCVHPMEGWDGTTTGEPSEYTIRRWDHFGRSGAKFLWGGEAFAVQSDGRANPNQIGIVDDNIERAEKGLIQLRDAALNAHGEIGQNTDDLFYGLQLTHSGRFCKPFDKKKLEPRIAYHHPLLDKKFGIDEKDDSRLLSDSDLEKIIANYIRAAKLAHKLGFHFVDVKHCHGYLGHELLSAFTRVGKFGGSFENRTRFAREIISGIQATCSGLKIGVRLSAFDQPPFKPDPSRGSPGKLGPGIPEDYQKYLPYVYGFGCDQNDPLEADLREPIQFIQMLATLGVKLINVTAASPYYNPHLQRPAIFPPSDGYQPPEDPLVGVVRQIEITRQLKIACPESIIVGTAYSYLQEYLPHVSQAIIREGWADCIGMGRIVLSYWDLPLDTLGGKEFQIKRICRTFSDCTTAPRNGMISGCFPLDGFYKEHPVHADLKAKKAELRKSLAVVKT